ncbi:MAG: FKBP-type peptidyl-prolyl cis-trans isomerase [Flavobacteriales bacterium]
MKKFILCIVACGSMLSSCEQSKVSNVKMKDERDSLSYTIGLSIGSSFMQSDLTDLNYDLLIKGMKDQKDSMSAMEMQEAEAYIQQVMTRKQEAKAAIEKEVGIKFLADNAGKPGVMTTASGLQYQVITEGMGKKPLATDNVTVHYHGTTIDGTVFDSSVDRGQPASFGLNQVIPGWTEGVQLMSVGSKYKLFIPENLAYGAQSPSPVIKPYSTLIFEVELISIDSTQGK